jgi:hypothetical protein
MIEKGISSFELIPFRAVLSAGCLTRTTVSRIAHSNRTSPKALRRVGFSISEGIRAQHAAPLREIPYPSLPRSFSKELLNFRPQFPVSLS